MDEVGRYDEEFLLAEAGDGQVGGDAAVAVEPLGVDQAADLAVYQADREPIEHLRRIRALHEELRHQAHVQDSDVLAHRAVLPADDVERALPGVVESGLRMISVDVVPLGELPAHRGVEMPAGGHQPVV